MAVCRVQIFFPSKAFGQITKISRNQYYALFLFFISIIYTFITYGRLGLGLGYTRKHTDIYIYIYILYIIYYIQKHCYIYICILYNIYIYYIQIYIYICSIVVIIFRDFLMFYQIFYSPQVKQSMIISNNHGIYKLLQELLSDLSVRILRNQEIPGKSLNFIELQAIGQPSFQNIQCYGQSSSEIKILSILEPNSLKMEI